MQVEIKQDLNEALGIEREVFRRIGEDTFNKMLNAGNMVSAIKLVFPELNVDQWAKIGIFVNIHEKLTNPLAALMGGLR